MERGSLCVLGVLAPGVDGGVNAGLTSDGGGGDEDVPLLRSSSTTSLPVEGPGE